MFRKGGSANEGIMHGLDRKGYANGSEWEDIAKAYQHGPSNILSTDYEDPENIEKWSEPINYDFFNNLKFVRFSKILDLLMFFFKNILNVILSP